ncbi:MAG: threonine/homoserine/homoserine lactone efflux protein [Paracoccaceae bacterium]|jgi:threonine/homoserine/homoserine lactone efflux protein
MIALDTLGPLAAFALAGTWTPGPNNAMLAASGANFGFRRTAPHFLGVSLGLGAMCLALGLGLGEVFRHSALLRETLRWVGAAAMLWIAWKIARAAAPGKGRVGARPLTFLQAAGFQWINPKAWLMSLGVLAQFATGAAPLVEATVIAGVFTVSGLTSSPCWTLFGRQAARWLGEGPRLRAFNLTMAAMVALGVIALLTEDLG